MDRVREKSCDPDSPPPSAFLGSQQCISAPLWAVQLCITPVTIGPCIPFGQPSWVQSSVTLRASKTPFVERLTDRFRLLSEVNQFPTLGTHRRASTPLSVRPSSDSSKAPPISRPSRCLYQRRHHILPAQSDCACRSTHLRPLRSIHTTGLLVSIISPTFRGR